MNIFSNAVMCTCIYKQWRVKTKLTQQYDLVIKPHILYMYMYMYVVVDNKSLQYTFKFTFCQPLSRL